MRKAVRCQGAPLWPASAVSGLGKSADDRAGSERGCGGHLRRRHLRRAFVAPEAMRASRRDAAAAAARFKCRARPTGLGHRLTSTRDAKTAGDARSNCRRRVRNPWKTLKKIGVVGGSILAVLIVVTTIIEYWPRHLEVPKAEHISKFVAAARSKLLRRRHSRMLRRRPEANEATGGAGERSSVAASPIIGLRAGSRLSLDDTRDENNAIDMTTGPRAIVRSGPQPPATSALERLPRGVEDWYAQPGARLAGIRRVNPTDPPIAHFSWMTGYCRFSVTDKFIKQFDFHQPLTKAGTCSWGRC